MGGKNKGRKEARKVDEASEPSPTWTPQPRVDPIAYTRRLLVTLNRCLTIHCCITLSCGKVINVADGSQHV
jgi:hypothetical protein